MIISVLRVGTPSSSKDLEFIPSVVVPSSINVSELEATRFPNIPFKNDKPESTLKADVALITSFIRFANTLGPRITLYLPGFPSTGLLALFAISAADCPALPGKKSRSLLAHRLACPDASLSVNALTEISRDDPASYPEAPDDVSILVSMLLNRSVPATRFAPVDRAPLIASFVYSTNLEVCMDSDIELDK